MVECSPATRAARVRFPADAGFSFLNFNYNFCNILYFITVSNNLK